MRKRHLNILKNFLFPKIHFERDIIPAKVWFLSGKRWLANNMTGQADIRLCKLGSRWWLVKWMCQALFFSLSSQRSKEAKKIIIITPDLRLEGEGRSLHDKDMFKTRNGEMTNVQMAKQWNSEITFLNSKNEWLPVFSLSPVAISLHSKNRQNSA